MFFGMVFVYLVEVVEDVVEVFFGDVQFIVCDFDEDVIVYIIEIDVGVFIFFFVFDGIVYQVGQYLMDVFLVSLYFEVLRSFIFKFQCDVVLFGFEFQIFKNFCCQGVYVEVLNFQYQFFGFEVGNGFQIFYYDVQVFQVFGGFFEKGGVNVWVFQCFVEQGVQVVLNIENRCFEFVGDVVNKVVVVFCLCFIFVQFFLLLFGLFCDLFFYFINDVFVYVNVFIFFLWGDFVFMDGFIDEFDFVVDIFMQVKNGNQVSRSKKGYVKQCQGEYLGEFKVGMEVFKYVLD